MKNVVLGIIGCLIVLYTAMLGLSAVSYTHLTLPTKRIV